LYLHSKVKPEIIRILILWSDDTPNSGCILVLKTSLLRYPDYRPKYYGEYIVNKNTL